MNESVFFFSRFCNEQASQSTRQIQKNRADSRRFDTEAHVFAFAAHIRSPRLSTNQYPCSSGSYKMPGTAKTGGLINKRKGIFRPLGSLVMRAHAYSELAAE